MSDNYESSPCRVTLVTFGTDGGMAQYPAQLANALAKRVNVSVISPWSTEVQELYEDAVSLTTFDVPRQDAGFTKRMINNTNTFVDVVRLIRATEPDLVHFPFFIESRWSLLLPVLYMTNTPTVGTVHDPISHSGGEVMIGGFDLRTKMRALSSKLMQAVIVHGQATLEQAKHAGFSKEKLRVVPHGLYNHFDVAGHHDVNPSDTDYELPHPYLLFFGNIRQNKGYDRIPAIMSAINERLDREVTAVVAGRLAEDCSKPWTKATMSELRKDKNVVLFQRYIPIDEVAYLFKNAVAAVLPYYDATTSGVAMIAYALNTPLIATDVGDIGLMVERDGSGLLADPNSNDQLADCIVKILTDTNLRDQIINNIESNKKKYSWENIANETLEVYNGVLDV